eukprot:scaffold1029_cov364-Pinguiococcus_pyrenoidosus.AAC.9
MKIYFNVQRERDGMRVESDVLSSLVFTTFGTDDGSAPRARVPPQTPCACMLRWIRYVVRLAGLRGQPAKVGRDLGRKTLEGSPEERRPPVGLPDGLDPFGVIDERIAVVLDAVDLVVAVALLVAHRILGVPCLEGAELAQESIGGGRARSIGGRDAVRELQVDLAVLPFVPRGHVEEHARDVPFHGRWRLEGVGRLPAGGAVPGAVGLVESGPAVVEVLGAALRVHALVRRSEGVDVGPRPFAGAEVAVGFRPDVLPVPLVPVHPVAGAVPVRLVHRAPRVERHDAAGIALDLVGEHEGVPALAVRQLVVVIQDVVELALQAGAAQAVGRVVVTPGVLDGGRAGGVAQDPKRHGVGDAADDVHVLVAVAAALLVAVVAGVLDVHGAVLEANEAGLVGGRALLPVHDGRVALVQLQVDVVGGRELDEDVREAGGQIAHDRDGVLLDGLLEGPRALRRRAAAALVAGPAVVHVGRAGLVAEGLHVEHSRGGAVDLDVLVAEVDAVAVVSAVRDGHALVRGRGAAGAVELSVRPLHDLEAGGLVEQLDVHVRRARELDAHALVAHRDVAHVHHAVLDDALHEAAGAGAAAAASPVELGIS